MKKLFLLVLTIFCSVAGFAQKRITTTSAVNHNLDGGSAPENNGFGIKGGLIISTVKGGDKDAYTNIESQKSYHAGLYSQFSITNVLSVQPEILYTRKGFKSASAGLGDLRMDYFDIPVLLSFRVLDNVSLHLGPQVGVLMTAKQNDQEIGGEAKKEFNSFDYGAAAGVEGRLSIFRMGARYNRSFGNIYKDGHMFNAKPAVDLHNNNFQIYVGVGF